MTTVSESGHFVQFFEDDTALVCGVCDFLRAGFESDATCIALTTAEHRARIADELKARGVDAAMLEAKYCYIPLDANFALSTFMGESGPDRHRFHKSMELLMRQAGARGQPVRVVGEMVGMLAERGDFGSVLALEELWNELSRLHPFTLLCGYLRSVFQGPAAQDVMKRICAVHSRVLSAA